MRSLRVLFLLCAAVLSNSLHAWNATGHMTVAEVAYADLHEEHPEILVKIITLLKQHHPDLKHLMAEVPSGLSPEDQDHYLFILAATWPDMVKTMGGKERNSEDHRPWHYVDFPFNLGDTKGPEPDITTYAPGSDPKNALQALDKCLGELKDTTTSDEQRARSVCWLLHLVGDIHQPLHCASCFSTTFPHDTYPTEKPFKNGDVGGNDYYLDDKKGARFRAELHAFWDDILGDSKDLSHTKKEAAALMQQHPRTAFNDALKIDDYRKWAHASFEIVTDKEGNGYYYKGRMLAMLQKPESGYHDKAKDIASSQISLAGYRLADELLASFK